MAKSPDKIQASKSERAWRLYRNWNILGGLALWGAAVTLPTVPLLAEGAVLNGIQAGIGEGMRRRAKKRRLDATKQNAKAQPRPRTA